MLFPLALLLAASLPDRLDLATPQPNIRKPVQPGKFLESVGHRGAILGREDGTFEAWISPVKVLRDFRLSVYFDGSLDPVPLADLAERVAVSPGRVTITHAHAAFTIRQTWVAAVDRPVLAVLLDIDTGRPLRLRATFLPELKPMWPASFGGQSSYFEESDHALVLGEGLRRWAAVVGSPLFTRHSEQVGHQLPDRTVLLEMDVTPDIARGHVVPVVIAASGKGSAAARQIYRDALAGLPGIVRESDAHYRDFAARTLKVETPEPALNLAFQWAAFALEKGWACNDGVGCGLVAGWGPSGASERPGFGWYFGGDAFMNSWAIADYGDLPRVRALLEFLRDHQRADGKMMHELTQSAALVDWSRYPYGYYHGDTTPLYLFSAARYVARSGDVDFLKKSWESLDRAYRLCLTWAGADGLLLNRKAGAAAVETGALSGKVEKDVYLQGAWLAALDGYARLADWVGRANEAAEARARLAHARGALESWVVPAKAFLPFGKLTDGTTYQALSGWQGLALAHGGPAQAAAALNRPELSTDWGVRLFSTDSPFYDPLSYNDGSVWPFVTGFVALAEFRNHLGHAGLQHLYGTAVMTGLSGAGFLAEYFSGERAQALPRAVPHQLFSSSAVVNPLVSGLLGLDGDAVAGTLRFEPHLPSSWPSLRFDGYRSGNSTVSGQVERRAGVLRLHLTVSGAPLKLIVSPALPAGSEVECRPTCAVMRTDTDVHATVQTAEAVSEFRLELRAGEGVEILPDLVAPEPGDRSRAVRLLSTRCGQDRIEFELAGPSGSEAPLRAWTGPGWKGDTAALKFPASTAAFSTTRVVFRR